jgi:hypothetical protein
LTQGNGQVTNSGSSSLSSTTFLALPFLAGAFFSSFAGGVAAGLPPKKLRISEGIMYLCNRAGWIDARRYFNIIIRPSQLQLSHNDALGCRGPPRKRVINLPRLGLHSRGRRQTPCWTCRKSKGQTMSAAIEDRHTFTSTMSALRIRANLASHRNTIFSFAQSCSTPPYSIFYSRIH